MRIISNTKLIDRNKKIGTGATIASLVVLGLGLYMSFQPTLMNYSLIALIVGFLLSQIGIYFGARWGRSPRPDETIAQSLKGLSDQYTLFSYTTPVPHLLVGPAGMWILAPFFQGGKITWDEVKKRFKQSGANWYLRIFGQEGIGKPDQDAEVYKRDLERFLEKNLPEGTTKPDPKNVLVFTSPKAHVSAEGSPVPAIHVDKLKEFIRKRAKEVNWTDERIKDVLKLFPIE